MISWGQSGAPARGRVMTPSARHLLEGRVLREYPYPVARPFRALTEQASPAGQFLCLLDTFESLVHFLATVTISAYCRGGRIVPECHRLLLDKFWKGQWGAGDFVEVLRVLSRRAGDFGGALPYPDLPGHFIRDDRPTAACKAFEEFVAVRNQDLAHRGGRTDQSCAELVREHRPRLE